MQNMIVLLFILKPCSLGIPLAIERAAGVRSEWLRELLEVPESLSKRREHDELANSLHSYTSLIFTHHLSRRAHFSAKWILKCTNTKHLLHYHSAFWKMYSLFSAHSPSGRCGQRHSVCPAGARLPGTAALSGPDEFLRSVCDVGQLPSHESQLW